MAARSIATYKIVKICTSGIVKNVIVPVYLPAPVATEDDDDCMIVKVEKAPSSTNAASSETSQSESQQENLVDREAEPAVETVFETVSHGSEIADSDTVARSSEPANHTVDDEADDVDNDEPACDDWVNDDDDLMPLETSPQDSEPANGNVSPIMPLLVKELPVSSDSFLPAQSSVTDVHMTDVVVPDSVKPNGAGIGKVPTSLEELPLSSDISLCARSSINEVDMTTAAVLDSDNPVGAVIGKIPTSLKELSGHSTAPDVDMTSSTVLVSDDPHVAGISSPTSSSSIAPPFSTYDISQAAALWCCQQMQQMCQNLVMNSLLQPPLFQMPPSATPGPVDPVVIAPASGTEVPALSGILPARTLTAQEAIDAGWISQNETVKTETLPDCSQSFVSSLELISSEAQNDNNGTSGSHSDIVPSISSAAEIPVPGCSTTSSLDASEPHFITNETNFCLKTEKSFDNDGNYVRVVEGVMDTGNAMPDVKPLISAKVSQRHGSPLRLRLPGDSRSMTGGINARHGAKTVRQSPGRLPKKNANRTAAKRYGLKECGVWLQQLQLSADSVNVGDVSQHLCCSELEPLVVESCVLCRGRPRSCNLLEIARKFQAGSREYARAENTLSEFSLDPEVLEQLPTNQPKDTPSEIAQTSTDNSCASDLGLSDSSKEENRKYLMISTENGSTFIVPVESAKGCIISKQEIPQILSSQSSSAFTRYAGEFSHETLLAACSQMGLSNSDKAAASSNDNDDGAWSTEAQNMPAPTATGSQPRQSRPRRRGRRKSKAVNDSRSSLSPPHLRYLRSVRSSAAAANSQIMKSSTSRRLSADLVKKARRFVHGSSMQRELRGLGIDMNLVQYFKRSTGIEDASSCQSRSPNPSSSCHQSPKPSETVSRHRRRRPRKSETNSLVKKARGFVQGSSVQHELHGLGIEDASSCQSQSSDPSSACHQSPKPSETVPRRRRGRPRKSEMAKKNAPTAANCPY